MDKGVSGSDHRSVFPARHRLGSEQPDETRHGDPGAGYGSGIAPTARDCIHHADRGSLYCSNEYHRRLSNRGFLVSMCGKGNCCDTSIVEAFFKSLKAELIWRNRWETRQQAEGAVFQCINGFNNPRRWHSAIGGKGPLVF